MKLAQPYNAEGAQVRGRSLGAILVDAGRLSVQQTALVVQAQKTDGLKFGETARQLGMINTEDILFALSCQFEYSYLQPGDVAVAPEVVAAFGSRSPVVEGLRDLRSQLILHWMGRETQRKSLALVSTRRHEGKSFIAANLAVLFSQLGQRTLLLDADLIHPRQHSLFKLDNRTGLSSILCGLTDLQAAQPIPQLNGLTVLPAGPPPPNPRELLSRPLFANLLEQAGQAFDVVLIDTPSAALADAQIIAAHAGATVLVSRLNAASLAETAALSAALGNLLGAVVNEF